MNSERRGLVVVVAVLLVSAVLGGIYGPNVRATTASATEASSGGALLSESDAETRTSQDPVISPVAESVPRSPEESGESTSEGAAVASSQESPHDHQHPA